jgi:feruloyl esterase
LFSERIALDTLQNLLWDPNPAPGYRLADFKFDATNLASMESARKLYNADDPNLRPFAARGGKLILWHGWSDQHISPLNTIDYFGRVGRTLGTARRDAMLRMFLLPGVGHCGGSDGPGDIPLLAALMAWVEEGTVPTMLVAQRAAPPAMPGGSASGPPARALVPRSRPIYAYPQIARYSGKGSADDATSFAPITPPKLPDLASWLGARH